MSLIETVVANTNVHIYLIVPALGYRRCLIILKARLYTEGSRRGGDWNGLGLVNYFLIDFYCLCHNRVPS